MCRLETGCGMLNTALPVPLLLNSGVGAGVPVPEIVIAAPPLVWSPSTFITEA